MSNSIITFREAQGNFFDREKVVRILGREVTGAMARVGAFIRTTAQRSIRPSRRWKLKEMPDGMRSIYERDPSLEKPFVSSQPGEAPRARTRRLKRSIFFAWDDRQRTGVVGPIAFPGSPSAQAPSVLESGGDSFVTVLKPKRKKKKRGPATEEQAEGLKKAAREGKLKGSTKGDAQSLQIPVKIAPRPYMRPAFQVVKPRIEGQFKNLIRGHIR